MSSMVWFFRAFHDGARTVMSCPAAAHRLTVSRCHGTPGSSCERGYVDPRTAIFMGYGGWFKRFVVFMRFGLLGVVTGSFLRHGLGMR